MRYLTIVPKEPIYIDGRKVVEYRVLATKQDIIKAYKRSHKNTGQKTVYQYDKGNSLVKIHDSITAAAKYVGGSRTHIGQVVDHPTHTSAGYIWSSKLK